MGNVTSYQAWLQRLERAEAARPMPTPQPAPSQDAPEAPADVPAIPVQDVVEWRVTAFRDRLPAHGPIWPPHIRDSVLCDAPGYCHLCGDALLSEPAPRYPRCQPCVQALWLVLHTQREEVPQAPDTEVRKVRKEDSPC